MSEEDLKRLFQEEVQGEVSRVNTDFNRRIFTASAIIPQSSDQESPWVVMPPMPGGFGFPSALVAGRERISDECAPYFVRVPNGVQVALGGGKRDALQQYSIKKDKCRDAFVGGAMDKDGPVRKSFHDSAEVLEIPRGGGCETYRDVDVGHAEASDDAPFVGDGVV